MQLSKIHIHPISLLTCFFLLVTLYSCKSEQSQQLFSINKIIEDTPTAALDSLHRIDRNTLNNHDLHYYDFLNIKATDKAFIIHQSDSLIQRVLNYYSPKDNIYPEVLYYGGRVYSDLGDYPTALLYYQQAFNAVENDSRQLLLKGRIASQTAQVLLTLRLYKEALPYAKIALSISQQYKFHDLIKYDLDLIGLIYQNMENYKTAEKYYRACLKYCDADSSYLQHRARALTRIAHIKNFIGDTDSAKLYLTVGLRQSSDLYLNSALAAACNIYASANQYDSVYYYATTLIHRTDSVNKQTGYYYLLSDNLRTYINPDSLVNYSLEYAWISESMLNRNENYMAIHQQAHYNYQMHLRERDRATAAKTKWQTWLSFSGIVILSLVALVLMQRYKAVKTTLQLKSALDRLIEFERTTPIQISESCDYTAISQSEDNGLNNSPDNLRLELLKTIDDFIDKPMARHDIPSLILESDTYQQIKALAKEKQNIPSSTPIWSEVEHLVVSIFPRFKQSLTLLLRGQLKDTELQTALLIKCGFTTTQMSYLLAISPNAVVSRREALGKKMFDKKINIKAVDAIIRSL